MKELVPENHPSLTPELAILLRPTTSIGALKRYVDRVILPKMDMVRGRTEPMSESEIIDKLYSIDQQKPGELMELMNSLHQEKAGFKRDPVEIALEIADIIYYGRQPRLSPFFQNHKPILEGLGLTYGDALTFCCLKYSIRLKNQSDEGTKREEYQAMKLYLGERGPRSFFDFHSFGRITFVNTQ